MYRSVFYINTFPKCYRHRGTYCITKLPIVNATFLLVSIKCHVTSASLRLIRCHGDITRNHIWLKGINCYFLASWRSRPNFAVDRASLLFLNFEYSGFKSSPGCKFSLQDVFSCLSVVPATCWCGMLTFWRRNYFFLILAHPVYKMWIIQEPNRLELWNKLHFEEGKDGEFIPRLKYSVPIIVE